MANPRTVRLPNSIDECVPARIKQLGMNFSQYAASLITFDLSVCIPHDITGDFHNLPAVEQDKIYAEIGKAYMSGQTLGGTWYKHRVEAATAAAGLPEPPPASRISRNLRKILSGKDNGKT